MTYESEERLMVQGIENDARRSKPHGEIPPTSEELVKIKQDKENDMNFTYPMMKGINTAHVERLEKEVETHKKACAFFEGEVKRWRVLCGVLEAEIAGGVPDYQKMLCELCDAVVKHFAKKDMINGAYLEVTDFIRDWKPRGE